MSKPKRMAYRETVGPRREDMARHLASFVTFQSLAAIGQLLDQEPTGLPESALVLAVLGEARDRARRGLPAPRVPWYWADALPAVAGFFEDLRSDADIAHAVTAARRNFGRPTEEEIAAIKRARPKHPLTVALDDALNLPGHLAFNAIEQLRARIRRIRRRSP
jgi:hypothetical protein